MASILAEASPEERIRDYKERLMAKHGKSEEEIEKWKIYQSYVQYIEDEAKRTRLC